MTKRRQDWFNGLHFGTSPREQAALETVSRFSSEEFADFRLWVASHARGTPFRTATYASALFACIAVMVSILLEGTSPLEPLLALVMVLAVGTAAVALLVEFAGEAASRRDRHVAEWNTVIEIERDRRSMPRVDVRIGW